MDPGGRGGWTRKMLKLRRLRRRGASRGVAGQRGGCRRCWCPYADFGGTLPPCDVGWFGGMARRGCGRRRSRMRVLRGGRYLNYITWEKRQGAGQREVCVAIAAGARVTFQGTRADDDVIPIRSLLATAPRGIMRNRCCLQRRFCKARGRDSVVFFLACGSAEEGAWILTHRVSGLGWITHRLTELRFRTSR